MKASSNCGQSPACGTATCRRDIERQGGGGRELGGPFFNLLLLRRGRLSLECLQELAVVCNLSMGSRQVGALLCVGQMLHPVALLV